MGELVHKNKPERNMKVYQKPLCDWFLRQDAEHNTQNDSLPLILFQEVAFPIFQYWQVGIGLSHDCSQTDNSLIKLLLWNAMSSFP